MFMAATTSLIKTEMYHITIFRRIMIRPKHGRSGFAEKTLSLRSILTYAANISNQKISPPLLKIPLYRIKNHDLSGGSIPSLFLRGEREGMKKFRATSTAARALEPVELEPKPQNEEKPSAASFCTLIRFTMESQDEVTEENKKLKH